jgi:hypothetical protein
MKKMFVLLLILGMASSAFSASVVQDLVKTTAQRAANAPLNQDWFTAANWNGSVNLSGAGVPAVPQNDTATLCNGATLYGSAATSYGPGGAVDSIIIAGGDAAVGQLRVGSSTTTSAGIPAALTINSGTLTIGDTSSTIHNSGFMSVGSDSATPSLTSTGRNGLFYMNGGAVTALSAQGAITIGNGNATFGNCYGKMWMTGGTIDSLIFRIGRYTGVTGEVYLSGGTITTASFTMGIGTALLDITGSGKLVINGDARTTIDGYIDNGWIKSNGVTIDNYSILSYDAGTNKTTMMVPEPATICLLGIGLFGLIRRK